jgi:SAM-dependent methyltransferase
LAVADPAGAGGLAAGPPNPDETNYEAYLQIYSNKAVPFQFRGIDFCFALSLGLFSSAGIDRGSRFLLKIFSRLLDEDLAKGRPLARRILDAGCGAGVLGICAGRALAEAAGGAPLVHAQDRDELARIFTLGNGARNRLDGGLLRARTEALLDGGAGGTWDLILSNVPAKAGKPVLEDFISRSAGLLAPGGRALIVVVNTLAGFFRAGIVSSGASLIREEAGPEHRVFVYGAGDRGAVSAGGPGENAPERQGGELPGPAGFSGLAGGPLRRSVYLRDSVRCEMGGIAYRIDTVHGAAEFDRPGGAAETGAKLLCRLGPLFPPAESPLAGQPFTALIHEGGQGHFPLWFLEFLKRGGRAPLRVLALHGRNILALWAARGNIVDAAGGTTEVRVAPGVDLGLDRDALAARLAGGSPEGAAGGDAARRRCAFIAAFPEFVPGTNPYGRIWEGLGGLLLPGGLALIALPAVEMDRLLKKRPPGFTRLGDLKRRGFRALAFRLG